jgi:pimeloyl-ACP methyl ester carboxylesterase
VILAMLACAPTYANLAPIEPSELWAPWPVQHLDVGGTDVAYVDSGGTGDPLVFVHGLSSYLGFWEYQLEHFAKAHRVLALDLPGYGASGRPDAPYTPPWYAEICAGFAEALSLDRATWVGHSMGGQIVMTLALAHPERVERLVLAAPAGFEDLGPGAGRFLKRWWHERRAMEATPDEVRANFLTMVFNRHDASVERLIGERVRLGRSEAFRGTSVAVARSVAGMLDHPVRDRLGEITAPTLVVFGTDDRMIPNPVFNGGATAAIAREGAARIPHASLVLVPGAGHTVFHDAPEAFNRAIEEFLP